MLKYIFSVDDASLTLLMVLFICFNAAWNAQKRSKYIAKAFISSFIAITVGAGITLAVLILSGSIEFIPMQVIPIAGMIAGNAMVAVGLCYNNLGQRVISEQQQIQEKLSLGDIDSRQYSRGFNSDGRFSKNGWLSEFTRNDVRADICRD